MKENIMSSKKNYSLEFNFHCSPTVTISIFINPSGLSEWFADDVNSRGEDFTFIWEDSEEYAKLLSKKNNESVKFMWVNDDEDYEKYYFEFLITVDEITKDVSLTVTDFSDDEELEESKMLWTNLVGDLKQVLGAV